MSNSFRNMACLGWPFRSMRVRSDRALDAQRTTPSVQQEHIHHLSVSRREPKPARRRGGLQLFKKGRAIYSKAVSSSACWSSILRGVMQASLWSIHLMRKSGLFILPDHMDLSGRDQTDQTSSCNLHLSTFREFTQRLVLV